MEATVCHIVNPFAQQLYLQTAFICQGETRFQSEILDTYSGPRGLQALWTLTAHPWVFVFFFHPVHGPCGLLRAFLGQSGMPTLPSCVDSPSGLSMWTLCPASCRCYSSSHCWLSAVGSSCTALPYKQDPSVPSGRHLLRRWCFSWDLWGGEQRTA